MTTKLRARFLTFLCATLLMGSHCSFAATEVVAAQPPRTKQAPGVELARTLSVVTGVAISPLLGVGAVGAYQWWRAEENRRPNLPWYAQPWFWIPALLLVALVAAKDILGTTVPGVLKKPLDIAEAIENKISALVAAGAFIPLLISILPDANADGAGLALPSRLFFTASISAGSLSHLVLTVFALAVFGTVWLTAHSINMLILLSPFATLDAALKAFRFSVLLFLTGLSYLSPYVGAVFCVILILICYWLAGWSFRLTIFGTTFIWDFVTGARHRLRLSADGNAAFTALRWDNAPVRTLGRLVRDDSNTMRFVYRPWGILKQRSLELPAGSYFVGRGLIYPEITHVRDSQEKTLFLLPPRFRTHEEEVASVYGLAGVRDVGLRRGIQAVRSWIASALGRRAAGRPAGVVSEG